MKDGNKFSEKKTTTKIEQKTYQQYPTVKSKYVENFIQTGKYKWIQVSS